MKKRIYNTKLTSKVGDSIVTFRIEKQVNPLSKFISSGSYDYFDNLIHIGITNLKPDSVNTYSKLSKDFKSERLIDLLMENLVDDGTNKYKESFDHSPVMEPSTSSFVLDKKEGKKWFKSKTIVVNVITLILYLCLLFNFNEKAAEKYITVVLPMVNIVLRLITKDPIKK